MGLRVGLTVNGLNNIKQLLAFSNHTLGNSMTQGGIQADQGKVHTLASGFVCEAMSNDMETKRSRL